MVRRRFCCRRAAATTAVRGVAWWCALFLLVAYGNNSTGVATATVLNVTLPAFALKLIVVETDRDVLVANTTEFRSLLNNVTADHLSRALTLALVTAVDVTTTLEGYKYELLDNSVTGDQVVLAVVFAGLQGTAYYDGIEVDIVPLVYTALSQETGFWDLAKAMVNNELLNKVAKMQIAADNRIVAEGNLVPDIDAADEKSDEEEPQKDEEADSSPGTVTMIVVAVCSIVAILIAVAVYLFWRYRKEQYLERKKAERRQLARKRRMMDNERSTSLSSSFNMSDSYDGSSVNKSPTKTHQKNVITKPSQEAKKEKRLLRIIEQSEEEGTDDREDDKLGRKGEGGSSVSFQSYQSSLTSLTCSPQKLAKGWNEQDVPDYLRNTRGFHTGSVPQAQTVSVYADSESRRIGSAATDCFTYSYEGARYPANTAREASATAVAGKSSRRPPKRILN